MEQNYEKPVMESFEQVTDTNNNSINTPQNELGTAPPISDYQINNTGEQSSINPVQIQPQPQPQPVYLPIQQPIPPQFNQPNVYMQNFPSQPSYYPPQFPNQGNQVPQYYVMQNPQGGMQYVQFAQPGINPNTQGNYYNAAIPPQPMQVQVNNLASDEQKKCRDIAVLILAIVILIAAITDIILTFTMIYNYFSLIDDFCLIILSVGMFVYFCIKKDGLRKSLGVFCVIVWFCGFGLKMGTMAVARKNTGTAIGMGLFRTFATFFTIPVLLSQ